MKKTATKPVEKVVATVAKKPTPHGQWVYKPLVSVIVLCACGNKYVATRPKQKTCIRCIQNR